MKLESTEYQVYKPKIFNKNTSRGKECFGSTRALPKFL